ncbi:MAG TPA: alpha/beta hydrolase [Spirochaetia bacterium]|nr:alpha/beta hydrolase [Spirochaetia bacterium]
MATLRLRLTLAAAAVLLVSCATAPRGSPLPEAPPDPASAPALRVEVDGIPIHAFDQGPEDADILVLGVHGWGASGAEGLAFGRALGREAVSAGAADSRAPTVRLVSPDLPGSGASGKPEAPYTPEWFVAILDGLREALRRDRVVLAGHSLGGRLALEYTLAHPERVEALILLAPAGLSDSFYPLDRWALGRDSIIRAGTRLTTERLYMRFYRKRVVRDPRYAYPDVAAWAVAGLLTPEGRSALREVTRHALAAPDLTDRLDEIEVPVLLVWGRDDEVLRFESSAAYRELLPDLRGFLALEDCGHHPQTERSARTARAAYEFLAGLRAAGTSPP